ncbi:MAG: NAD(P)-binding protein, partial [Candidatus Thermoplasmatota archaeon]
MKIGVYVCECGINIAKTVDVEKVTESAKSLPFVAISRYYKYVCSEPGQALIKKDIKELKLDRVVVASCSPRMHEPTFRNACKEAGLNQYCFEMANIREHCSWVHENKKEATEKAIELVRGAVHKSIYLEPLSTKDVNIIPKALVIGGGIAGIQSALDIADAGHKVYLVEKEPSIGGRMAQLDKTFPTLDCSACILTPKMVDAARNPNIELITYSEIAGVEGYIGNFKVKVKKKSKYVDWTKCNGCGECIKHCPVKVLNEFDMGLGTRTAIYIPFPQSVPLKYTIDKKGISPCTNACPAGVHAQGYIALISQGKFKEALALIREKNPFPAICGRVCHHPCEDECNRKELEEPIAIRALKRFASDYVRQQGEEPVEHVVPTTEKKVAVVGAGPSGLTCALNLLELGYQVTIFESSNKPGGMLLSCLPEYRIPKELAEYDINRIIKRGITMKINTSVGKDVTLSSLKKEFDAIYIAIGMQEPAKLQIEGSDAKGVLYGLEFLREAKAGKLPKDLGINVIVIGGGNVAVDCAKTALRLGAKEVNIVCLETRDLSSWDRMPAHDWEIEEAEEEGVVINHSLGPKRILTENGKITGLETIACVSVYDKDKKFAPKFDAKKPSPIIKGDTIIIAIGQRSNLTGFEELESVRGLIKVDTNTLQTSEKGIFAGGDIVRGPVSVVEAIADGNLAATSIDRYLKGESLELRKEEKHVVKIEEVDITKVEKRKRARIPKLPPKERKDNFKEIELTLTEQQAIEESKRCLNCAVCSECKECEKYCEPKAILHEQKEEIIELDVGTIVVATGYDLLDATSKPEYGYNGKNVITGLEFERLCSASGPTGGEIVINGSKPKNVVLIQCVGSREREGNQYCSRVCCMYTAKQAHLVRDKLPDANVTIFYTDVRAFGKGFEEFYNRVQAEGVKYLRRDLEDPIQVIPNGGSIVVKAKNYEDIK